MLTLRHAAFIIEIDKIREVCADPTVRGEVAKRLSWGREPSGRAIAPLCHPVAGPRLRANPPIRRANLEGS